MQSYSSSNHYPEVTGQYLNERERDPSLENYRHINRRIERSPSVDSSVSSEERHARPWINSRSYNPTDDYKYKYAPDRAPSEEEERKRRMGASLSQEHPPPSSTTGESSATRLRRGSLFLNVKEIPIIRAIDPPPYACFNCWQFGHSRRHCPRPTTAQFCYNCGRRGVTLMNCPRCSEAHKRWLLENPNAPSMFEDVQGPVAESEQGLRTEPEQGLRTEPEQGAKRTRRRVRKRRRNTAIQNLNPEAKKFCQSPSEAVERETSGQPSRELWDDLSGDQTNYTQQRTNRCEVLTLGEEVVRALDVAVERKRQAESDWRNRSDIDDKVISKQESSLYSGRNHVETPCLPILNTPKFCLPGAESSDLLRDWARLIESLRDFPSDIREHVLRVITLQVESTLTQNGK